VDSLGFRLAMRPSAAVLVRVLAGGLSFLIGVAAARALSVSDFGVLNLLLAATNIGIVIALLGHEDLATRNAAIATAIGDAHGLGGYRQKATRNILIMGLLASTLVALAYYTSGYLGRSGGWITAAAFTVILLCSARARYAQSLVRGRHFPALAVIPEGIIKPGLGVCLVLVVAAGKNLWAVAVALAVAATAGLIVALMLERKVVHLGVSTHETTLPTQHFSPYLFGSSILAILGGQMALLLTGHLAGSTPAAFYATADRIASATAIVAQALFLAIASRISRLHTLGDSVAMAGLVRRHTRHAATITAAMALAIVLLAAPILRVFGPAYIGAKDALSILMLAAFLNAAAGPTGMILVMTKHERLHAGALGISLLCQLTMSSILIPRYGLLGAAGATLIFTLLWNGLMLFAIWRRLGLRPILAWA
jgi:O-antigen/teichoic acid export membrane protein